MRIPADQPESDSKRTKSFSDWIKAIMGIARRLVRFLDFTEEDRIKAGIYLGYDK
jgi:hypothetical protein